MQSILVVGAGPTGLALAAVLARHGLSPRIIDKASVPPDDRSRAIVLQARTLEVFRDLGIDEEILAGALIVDAATLVLPSGRRGSIRFRPEWIESRFNRITSLPQDETERVLVELLARSHIVPERGVTLTDMVQDAHGVACTLEHADGREEAVRVDWIVGADGAHSAVRHDAGLSFEGETYPDEALLGDVDIDWALADREIAICPGGSGFLLAFPLPGVHRFRIIMIHPAAAPSSERTLSQEEFMRSLVSMLPRNAGTPRLLATRWLTRYRLHRRGVPRYRSGRAFVAGDAAHIHSPVGAQGMNTGIQDAYNLGWKLALVARGEAPASILDSYNEERFPVGEKLLRGTDFVFGLVARGGFIARALRSLAPGIGVRLISTGFIGRKASRLVSQTTIRYRHSSLVSEGPGASSLGPEAPHAGDRLPDVQLPDGTWLHDAVRGSQHTVLVIAARANEPAESRIAAFVARYGANVRILPRRREGALTRFAGEDGGVYLIRPDKHIGFRGSLDDLPALESVLAERLVAIPQEH